MRLQDLQRNWDRMGSEDPLWAVATAPQYKGGKWDPEIFFESGRNQVDAILQHADSLGQHPMGTAFDFGCGVGRLSQALTEHFEQVVGIDIAPSMIAEAHGWNRQGEKVKYVLNEKPNLSLFDDRSFDFIYTEITLMHMEPRYSMAYISEFFRIARRGALVVFHIVGTTQRQKMRERIPRPILYFGNKLRTLRAPMMEIYGLERRDVADLVSRAGGTMLDIQEWQNQGRMERRYWATAG
jgi:SAM-dependent methyltransferase